MKNMAFSQNLALKTDMIKAIINVLIIIAEIDLGISKATHNELDIPITKKPATPGVIIDFGFINSLVCKIAPF